MHEIRYVLRGLARSPRFWLLPALTLALAIGGGGALLSLFNAFMLRQLAVERPAELVTVYPGIGEAVLGLPIRTLAELRKSQDVVSDLCGYSRGSLQVEVQGTVSPHTNEAVTGNCYRMLGVQPHIGRLLDERDAPDAGDPALVAVISHRFWTRAFDRDPAAVGRTLRVQGVPLTIVGVTPPAFNGIDVEQAPDLTVSLGTLTKLAGGPPANAFALFSIGRLRQDTTLAEARASLRLVWPAVWAETNPTPPGRQPSRAAAADALQVESVARGLSEQRILYGAALSRLVVLSGIVLLLACLNVGGVLLARTVARDRELAVRAALGASRLRIAGLLALEGVVLAAVAAVAAVPIAWWASRYLAATAWIRVAPTTLDAAPEAWVLVAIGGVGLGAGVIACLPALAVVSSRRWQLTDGGPRVTAAAGTGQRTLIVGQVAVTLALVFCAGLFARNLAAIRSLYPGYEPDGLRWTRLELVYGQPAGIDQGAYFRPIIERIQAIPGVSGAALSVGFPTTERRHVAVPVPFTRADAFGIEAVPGDMEYVSPGFFAMLGVRLLQGREMAWSDTEKQPAVAVINRALATRLFPGGGAIGGRVQSPQTAGGSPGYTVVGVVENSSPGDVRIRDLPTVFVSLLQNPRVMSAPPLVVRTSDAAGLERAIRSVIEPLGRHRVSGLQTIANQADRFHMRERVLAGVSAAFAGLSLLVGSLGLYGLLAQMVAGRTRELGVRRALGASGARVVSMVLREGMLLVGAGLALGLPVVFVAGRAARVLLYDVPEHDPVALVGSMVLLAGVALVACGWPARRAAAIGPVEALRHD